MSALIVLRLFITEYGYDFDWVTGVPEELYNTNFSLKVYTKIFAKPYIRVFARFFVHFLMGISIKTICRTKDLRII